MKARWGKFDVGLIAFLHGGGRIEVIISCIKPLVYCKYIIEAKTNN